MSKAGITTISNEQYLEYIQLKNELKEFINSNNIFLRKTYLSPHLIPSSNGDYIITKDEALKELKNNHYKELNAQSRSYELLTDHLNKEIRRLEQENKRLKLCSHKKNYWSFLTRKK